MEDDKQLEPKFLALKNRLNGMVPEGKTDRFFLFSLRRQTPPPHFLSSNLPHRPLLLFKIPTAPTKIITKSAKSVFLESSTDLLTSPF